MKTTSTVHATFIVKRWVAFALSLVVLMGHLGCGQSPVSRLNDISVASSVENCEIFPKDNPWNQDISTAPVDANSAAYLASMNAGTRFLHPDFGSDPSYGIPYIIVDSKEKKTAMSFDYDGESDPGPYPFPLNAPVEGGPNGDGDRHVIAIDKDACILYEAFACSLRSAGWHCASGAVFNLRSNQLRPDGYTSADAAGLPIFAGLARYDEINRQKEIRHALRFTVKNSQNAFVHPATHAASSKTDANLPPMGLRVRLKADFNLSKFSGNSLVILTALKKYGMFVADNGSDWYISGETNSHWDDDDLSQIKKVPASAFEVVRHDGLIRLRD